MRQRAAPPLGVVAIGRNEGERLRRCLESVLRIAAQVVYVDSGSTDNSVAMACGLGVAVVHLDTSIPFTAARARNEGLRHLSELDSGLSYVQFVDGDCEVVDGWLPAAQAFLARHPGVAAVCGRRRERFPERSIYNRLCDLEWETPEGEARACGGDALMRIEALRQVGGFRPDLIAGEEPELCLRLRAAGWRIWRLGCEMTRHDAAITRFAQWWKRAVRTGHAFAEGACLHGRSGERHYVRESRRAWFWGGGLPVAILALAMRHPAGLWLALLYPLQVMRLGASGASSARGDWWRALFLVLGKFPEAQGQMSFWVNRLGRRKRSLIEYK